MSRTILRICPHCQFKHQVSIHAPHKRCDSCGNVMSFVLNSTEGVVVAPTPLPEIEVDSEVVGLLARLRRLTGLNAVHILKPALRIVIEICELIHLIKGGQDADER